MSVLKIIVDNDPILRRKSKAVEKITKRLQILVKDMLETMYQAEGVGLAAPQIGINERLIVVDVGDGPVVLFNPKIMQQEGTQRDLEGCLSLPGKNEYVTRADKVVVAGIDLSGRKVTYEGSGLLARAFQHEIDHLEGILFIDHLEKEQ